MKYTELLMRTTIMRCAAQTRLAFLTVISMVVSMSTAQSVWAWEESTHELLTGRAAEVSDLQTGVLTRLGFENLDTQISRPDLSGGQQSKPIRDWIKVGARFEDGGSLILGNARFLNHFHNPLFDMPDWPNAGLNDSFFTGTSSPLWAQDALANPNWSWPDVRGAFYQALTQQEKYWRDAMFTQVFAGLGNVVHLIQDMAQPAHVRNDAHPEDPLNIDGWHPLNRMENWAVRMEDEDQAISALAQTVPTQSYPSLPLTRVGNVNGLALGPISEFWDTDQYQGDPAGFPYWGADGGRTLGLAEYTNGSYFSNSTINSPDSNHQFPRPPVHIGYYSVCRDDPPASAVWGTARWYISRYPCPTDPQQRPDHFLAQSLLGTVLLTQPDSINPSLRIDDRVMADYAKDLIPRAVGYSAKLIDYFFRGDLAVEVIDPTHVRVVNSSAEPMNQGTIQIFYDTKDAQNRVINGSYTISSVIAPGGATADITITTPPSDPSNPASNLTPGRYGAVFQGTLGAEENAVIGTSRFQWQENWDHALITAPHNWYQTTLDPNVGSPSYGGERTAVLLDDALSPPSKLLSMRNYRPAGVPGDQIGDVTLFQPNLTVLGQTAYPTGTDPASHYDTFPIVLLPETELQVKVKELNANFPTPVVQCLVAPWEAWHNGAYQHLVVEFNYGAYELELTVPGQQRDTRKVGAVDGLIALTPGQEQRINIYQALQTMGAPVGQQGFNISAVKIEQMLLPPCQTTTSTQEQTIQSDYLRFVDVPPGTP
jgi:hypothetical protein